MVAFSSRLADGWTRAQQHLPLAVVPFITALASTDKISAITNFDGIHFGINMSLPTSVVDIWGFVNVPETGVNVYLNGPTGSPLLVVVGLPLAVVLQAGLAAGYFGSIADLIRAESYQFGANVRRYFLPFLIYSIIPVVLLGPVTLLGVAGGQRGLLPLVVLLIPVYLLLAYLFYPTPYLVVLHETDLLSAARDSYELAASGGPYFSFTVGFLGFTLIVSLVATAVVVNTGVVGVLLGACLGAPIGLAANITTMQFVADIDPQSPTNQGEPVTYD